MLGAYYKSKKALKASIGQPLKYIETSPFGEEYHPNGTVTVVGPDPYFKRIWYAQVHMHNGLIEWVK